MPMPPYHCVICRHIRMPRPWASTSVSTVEPVQLKPEIDSNRAPSKALHANIEPNTYGSDPTREHAIQLHATIENTDTAGTSRPRCVTRRNTVPTQKAMTAVSTRGHSSCDVVEAHSIAAAINRPGVRNTSASPTTCNVGDSI